MCANMSPSETRKARNILIAAGVVAIAIAVLLIVPGARRAIVGTLRGVDFDKMEKMNSIKVGMTEADVIRILGKPDEVITAPEITEYHGPRSEYGKKIPNPNRCLVYVTGIDYMAHYVLDANGVVTYVNVGGT